MHALYEGGAVVGNDARNSLTHTSILPLQRQRIGSLDRYVELSARSFAIARMGWYFRGQTSTNYKGHD
jgi:hypothetical protein